MAKENNTREADTWELARAKFPKMENWEFEMVKAVANKYGLDPLIGEIVVYRIGGELTMFTTRDGYLGIAHRSGQYDRLNAVIIAQNPEGEIAEVDVLPKGWELIGAKAYLYKIGNPNPLILSVPLSEYYRPRTIWDRLTQTMIKKVAESQALRKGFNVSGLYAIEEKYSFDDPAINATTSPAVPSAPRQDNDGNKKLSDMSEEEKKVYIVPTQKLFKKLGEITGEGPARLQEEYLEMIGAKTYDDLTVAQMRELYAKANNDFKAAANAAKK